MNKNTEILESIIANEGLTYNSLAKRIGLNRSQMLYDIRDGKTKAISSDLAKRIVDTFPHYDMQWVLSGEGDMYNKGYLDAERIDNEDDMMRATENGESLIPEHGVSFRGGDLGEALANDNVVALWRIPNATGSEIISIEGDSMAPVYPSGTRIVLKEMGFSIEHPTSIPFGNPFAIEVEDPSTNQRVGYVKYLRRHPDPEMAKKYWVAHSADSAHFDDFDIPIEYVKRLWIVEWAMRKVF